MPLTHTDDWSKYAAHGAYTITVTAHSIGCNGTHEQRGTKTLTWNTQGYNP